MFQVNPLLSRGVTWKIKPYFLWKIKSKKLKCRLLQFLFGALRVKRQLFVIISMQPAWTSHVRINLPVKLWCPPDMMCAKMQKWLWISAGSLAINADILFCYYLFKLLYSKVIKYRRENALIFKSVVVFFYTVCHAATCSHTFFIFFIFFLFQSRLSHLHFSPQLSTTYH